MPLSFAIAFNSATVLEEISFDVLSLATAFLGASAKTSSALVSFLGASFFVAFLAVFFFLDTGAILVLSVLGL